MPTAANTYLGPTLNPGQSNDEVIATVHLSVSRICFLILFGNTSAGIAADDVSVDHCKREVRVAARNAFDPDPAQ